MKLNKLNKGKPLAGKTPSRYYTTPDVGNPKPENARSWIEFYPQNCWQDCVSKNLVIEDWNGNSSKSQMTDRIKSNNYLEEEGGWIGIDNMEALQKLLRVGDMTKPVKLSPTFGTSIVNLSTP